MILTLTLILTNPIIINLIWVNFLFLMPLLTFIAISGVCQGLGALLTKSYVYYYCVGLSRSHLFWFYSSQRGPAHHGPQCTEWMDTGPGQGWARSAMFPQINILPWRQNITRTQKLAGLTTSDYPVLIIEN